jgi:prepilin-type processing-associated H-X9-DG protein
VAFTEVKAYQLYLRNCGNPAVMNAPPPATPADAVALRGSLRVEVGHTEWTDSPIHQSGVSFVFPPNTKVPYSAGGVTHDVDVVTSVEGTSATLPTDAVVTARSDHTGGIVNTLMMDGSVRGCPPTSLRPCGVPPARATAARRWGWIDSQGSGVRKEWTVDGGLWSVKNEDSRCAK